MPSASILVPYTSLFRSVKVHGSLLSDLEDTFMPTALTPSREQSAPSPEERQSVRLTLRSEEHTSELQSRGHLVCPVLHEKKTEIRLSYQHSSGAETTVA